MHPSRVVAVVLAAGAGSRFGGSKMAARIGGRSLPAHALDAARAAGIETAVVVLGRDATAVAGGLASAAPFLRVVNAAPERGLASSLRLGLAAACATAPDGILVLLGDQPFVRPEVIARLLTAEAPAGTVAVAPRYAGDAALNPVLLLPPGFGLATRAEGDRGLGPLLVAAGDLVVRLPVDGTNPDIDTQADLAAHRSST